MQRLRTSIIAALAAVILLTLPGEVTFRLRRPAVFSQGPNGIWLRHAWAGGAHSARGYDELAAMLDEMRITEAYFHAGPLAADGSVDPDLYPNAAYLLRAMQERLPDLRIYAWLGQIERRGGGPLDLSDPTVRIGIVDTISVVLALGFDGVHLNIEPIRDGDPDFLALLRAARAFTASRHGFLSVAAYKPEPLPGLAAVAGRLARFPGYWRRPYFLAVAGEVDQMAIMTYDTARN